MTIEEIKKEKDKVWEQYQNLCEELRKEEIKEYDYTGKYIYRPDYGYMYVKHQEYFKNEDIMSLQGLVYNGYLSEYDDDIYFIIDALKEWDIPLSTIVEDKKIKVLTKEEFIKNFQELYGQFFTSFSSLI